MYIDLYNWWSVTGFKLKFGLIWIQTKSPILSYTQKETINYEWIAICDGYRYLGYSCGLIECNSMEQYMNLSEALSIGLICQVILKTKLGSIVFVLYLDVGFESELLL